MRSAWILRVGVLSHGTLYHSSLYSWWRHQMETFSALLTICAGNSPVTGEFPAQRPVTQSLDVFYDLRMNKRLSKQSWGWWFETPSDLLWRHCNDFHNFSTLTHWGRVKHICDSKLTVIGSDIGLLPGRWQSIIWANAEILIIRNVGTNFREILNEIHVFSFKKMHLKMSSAKWRAQCVKDGTDK